MGLRGGFDMIAAVDYIPFSRKFKKIFGLEIQDYIDESLSTSHETCFDYAKFDKIMFERHFALGYDEKSLSDIILENYGSKGVELIEKML